MKVLADEEREDVKLVVVGINKAGDALVRIAPDLNSRIETIIFESNPDEKVLEVIELGEAALNISFTAKKDMVEASAGSFYIAQYLCHESCLQANILETKETHAIISTS